mmetsp:Transcript_65687/g.148232  ORF Transcript_65687/g.148232 Transcript_65687/m.148232 type:complete len:100 (-) Transcript_65687:608-907(-)
MVPELPLSAIPVPVLAATERLTSEMMDVSCKIYCDWSSRGSRSEAGIALNELLLLAKVEARRSIEEAFAPVLEKKAQREFFGQSPEKANKHLILNEWLI